MYSSSGCNLILSVKIQIVVVIVYTKWNSNLSQCMLCKGERECFSFCLYEYFVLCLNRAQKECSGCKNPIHLPKKLILNNNINLSSWTNHELWDFFYYLRDFLFDLKDFIFIFIKKKIKQITDEQEVNSLFLTFW